MINSPRQRRMARQQQLIDAQNPDKRAGSSRAKVPITVEKIVRTSFGIIAKQGYESLTMRSLAAALQTGPASLYAHVINKADLDELLMVFLAKQITLPEPDRTTWREQIIDVCTQIRDHSLRYPGITKANFAVVPTSLDIFRISEGMLSIFLIGGVEPQAAAWTMDALLLYINAYCLEQSLHEPQPNRPDDVWGVSRQELRQRFANLPDKFPNTKRYAAQMTAGHGHDRFDFTIRLIINSAGNIQNGNS